MRFAREGWLFVVPVVAAAALLFAAGLAGWAIAALVASLAVLAFFRDPRRHFDGDDGIVLAPADGLVTAVEEVEDRDLGPGRYQRIVTFLSVFDVHVQKTPVAGQVVTSRYARGRKVAAFRADAGEINEMQVSVIRRPNGDQLAVRQIAGLLARRVVCYLAAGMPVARGQAMGLIKFGSRVDLVLPLDYRVLVQRGDRLRNGATPVAAAPTAPAAAGPDGRQVPEPTTGAPQ
jgi:phosphatidylserine decarboxylase